MSAYVIGGGRVKDLLREAVKGSEGTLAPEAFAELAGLIMNRAAASAAARAIAAERHGPLDVEGTMAHSVSECCQHG